MTGRKKLTLFLLAVACVLAYTPAAFAHSTGASFSSVVGPYTVDIGYDPAIFTAGQYTRFDFVLWKGTDEGQPQAFSQVWVRIISTDKDTLLATGIWKQPVGPTTLLFEFSKPGSYTLEASYRDQDGKDIAVASFPITVQSGGAESAGSLATDLLLLLGGVALGAILYSLVRRTRT